VAKTVALDQALTGRILRYANSAAGGSQKSVMEVGVAVMRMGPGMVLSIALGDGLNKNGLKGPDGTFTAALVHDVGKLVIGRKLHSMGIVLKSENPEEPWVDESKQLGIDHGELGESVVRS